VPYQSTRQLKLPITHIPGASHVFLAPQLGIFILVWVIARVALRERSETTKNSSWWSC